MKKKIFTLIIAAFALGCTHAPDNSKEQKILLQGSWFDKDSKDLGSAIFSVMGDSVTYPDGFNRFKYTLSDDIFDIQTKGPHTGQRILKLTKDSLVLQDVSTKEIIHYWKNK
jgi:hypothetical protein